MFAPAIPSIMADFQSSNGALAGFVVSVYLLGNATGPVFLAPLSEIIGRRPVLGASSVLFAAFTAACALSTSLPMLFVFRFLAGAAGAAPLAVAGGTIADMVTREQRGRYFGVFAIGPQLAPIVGPVMGGFVCDNPALGWRWTSWLVAIVQGVVLVGGLFFLAETYAPVLLKDKCHRLQRAKPEKSFRIYGTPEEPLRLVIKRASVRPAKMLFRSPVVLFLAIFQACVYGYRYVIFTTIPLVFVEQYGFTTAELGLSYLGSAFGASVALYTITKACDELVIRYKRRHDDEQPPAEIRLLPMAWASPLTVVGLLWYGWSAQTRMHWIVPILGTTVFGAGVTAVSLPSNIYMVDAFPQFAASGLAASFFLRSVVGGFLPLAGTPLYSDVGVGWGSSILAFIALILCAFPPIIVWKGRHLRERFVVDF